MIRIDDVSAFGKLLGEVARYASVRTTIEAQFCILIDAHDGEVEVSAYDGFRVCVRREPIDGDLLVLVNARKLCSLFSNFTEPAELSVGKNGWLLIKSGTTEVSLPGLPPHMAVRSVEQDGVAIESNAHELAELLGFGMQFSSVEKGGGEKAIQIIPSYGVVTSNSFIGSTGATLVSHVKDDRFAPVEADRVCLRVDHLKPAVAAMAGLGTEDVAKVTFCESHVTFSMPGCDICIRTLEPGTVGKIPISYLEADKEFTSQFLTTTESVRRPIKIMSAIAPPEKRTIRLYSGTGNLQMTQSATELGGSEHSVEVMGDFNGQIFMDMDMLGVALSCFRPGESVQFKYSGSVMSLSSEGREVFAAGTGDV